MITDEVTKVEESFLVLNTEESAAVRRYSDFSIFQMHRLSV